MLVAFTFFILLKKFTLISAIFEAFVVVVVVVDVAVLPVADLLVTGADLLLAAFLSSLVAAAFLLSIFCMESADSVFYRLS